jgi:hypothetical protein
VRKNDASASGNIGTIERNQIKAFSIDYAELLRRIIGLIDRELFEIELFGQGEQPSDLGIYGISSTFIG